MYRWWRQGHLYWEDYRDMAQGWSNTGTRFLARWLMPRACLCSKGNALNNTLSIFDCPEAGRQLYLIFFVGSFQLCCFIKMNLVTYIILVQQEIYVIYKLQCIECVIKILCRAERSIPGYLSNSSDHE